MNTARMDNYFGMEQPQNTHNKDQEEVDNSASPPQSSTSRSHSPAQQAPPLERRVSMYNDSPTSASSATKLSQLNHSMATSSSPNNTFMALGPPLLTPMQSNNMQSCYQGSNEGMSPTSSSSSSTGSCTSLPLAMSTACMSSASSLFPMRLHQLLCVSDDRIIQWQPENDGRSFTILDCDKFETEILPRYVACIKFILCAV